METIGALVGFAVIVLLVGIGIHAAYRKPGGSDKAPKQEGITGKL